LKARRQDWLIALKITISFEEEGCAERNRQVIVASYRSYLDSRQVKKRERTALDTQLCTCIP
jgi:hypothetical protein